MGAALKPPKRGFAERVREQQEQPEVPEQPPAIEDGPPEPYLINTCHGLVNVRFTKRQYEMFMRDDKGRRVKLTTDEGVPVYIFPAGILSIKAGELPAAPLIAGPEELPPDLNLRG